MSNTTKDNVALIAPGIKDYICKQVELVSLILADVADEVTAAQFGGKQEKAQRYLAAHALTLIEAGSTDKGASSASGPVTSNKVGDVEKRYGSSDFLGKNRLDETAYGREFNRIRSGCILNFRSYAP